MSGFHLISYDIVEDKRRVKVSKTLKDYGTRVQYSVFECLIEREQLQELQERVAKIINEDEDSVRVYVLCERCRDNIRVMGQGRVTEDEEVYIV